MLQIHLPIVEYSADDPVRERPAINSSTKETGIDRGRRASQLFGHICFYGNFFVLVVDAGKDIPLVGSAVRTVRQLTPVLITASTD